MSRGYLSFALILCLCLYITGCGRPAEDVSAPDTGETAPPDNWTLGDNAQAPVSAAETLELTLSYYGGVTERDELSALTLKPFGLDIKLVPYPEDYAALLALLASDTAPDVIRLVLSPARLAELTGSGYIREIPDGVIEASERLNAYVQADPPARAYRLIYGAYAYLPCAYDVNPAYAADGTRLFYRKDWAATLGLTPPADPGGLYEMAKAYAIQVNPNSGDGSPLIGLVLEDTAILAALYGYDADGWHFQNGRYIPAYCADGMLPMLNYARRLRDEGLLVFAHEAGGRISLNDAGIIAACGDNGAAVNTLLSPVADSLGVSTGEALSESVGIMDIPRDPQMPAVWRNDYNTEGLMVGRHVSGAALERFAAFLDYTLSDEARVYDRYGIEGVTYTENENGIFMFTDPETFAAYDLNAMYPTGGYLNLLTADASRESDINMPSGVPYPVRGFADEATKRVYVPTATPDMLCRAVNSPLRDAYEMDYETSFYNIITGTEPVDAMFDQFRDACRAAGLDGVIEEVNRLLPAYTEEG